MSNRKFINPLMDVSFKKLFGEDDSKKLLIEFLNDIFDGKKIIDSIEYINTEILPELEDGKKNLLDILCKDNEGNRYIIEMQVRPELSFSERMLYYLARVMSKNSLKANQNYSFVKGVYAVVLMNFTLPEFNNLKKLVFSMREETMPSLELSSRFTEIFIQLPLFEKVDFSKCCTYLEKWIYLLLNMEHLEFMPDFLEKDKAIFKELLEKARQENLSDVEREAYELQVMQYRSYLSSFDYAINEGLEKGFKQGLEQGLEQAQSDIILNLLSSGLSPETISNYTKIPLDIVMKTSKINDKN